MYVYLHLLRCNQIDEINRNEVGTQHNPAGGFEKLHKDTYGKQKESPFSKNSKHKGKARMEPRNRFSQKALQQWARQ